MAVYSVDGLIFILLVYFLILMIGLIATWKRYRQIIKTNSSIWDNFILAGRKTGFSTGAFTMSATWIGGILTETGGAVYTDGILWALAPIGFALSLLIGGTFFATKMKKRDFSSVLEPLQEQYGNAIGSLLYLPVLVSEILWTLSMLSLLSSSLCIILRIDLQFSLILSIGVIVTYTFIGGLYAVICTDVFQVVFMAVGLFISLPYAMSHESVRSISDTNSTWTGNVEKHEVGKWIDHVLLLALGGIPWQVYIQRVLSSRSPQTSRWMSYAGALGCLILATPALFLGVAAKSTNWNSIQGVSREYVGINGTIIDTRLTLPLVLQYLTPNWVSYVGLGAIASAVISSVDSSFLSVSCMFGQSIYKTLIRPNASDIELVWITRIGILALGCFSLLIGVLLPNLRISFFLCFDWIYVLLFPQLLAALYVPWVNSYGSIAALLMGLFFRLTGGNCPTGLSALIEYPLFRNNEQYFPFRTLAMMTSFLTLLVVSYVLNRLFSWGYISRQYDVCGTVIRRERRYELDYRQATMLTELNYRLSVRDTNNDELKRANSVI